MIRRLVLISLLLALLLAACQAPAAPTPTATPPPPPPPTPTSPPPTATLSPSPTPFPESVARSEIVNGNKLIINCKGTGNATVILDNGYSAYSWTDPGNYPKITRTCSYTRAGMMEETIKGPRTTADVVKDLHDLLTQVGVPGPYILVGHSQAGFNLMLYTGTYPEEVVGLVCVDCLLPIFYGIALVKEKPELANDPDQLQKEVVENLPYAADSKEKLDFKTSVQQALKVKSLGSRPVVALVAGIYPAEWEGATRDAWVEASLQFSKMSTQGRMEIVEGYDHPAMPTSLAVYKAIQEVYDKVKKP